MEDHTLFIEIDKFDVWADKQSDTPQDNRGGEWECDYLYWDKIYDAFEDFIVSSNSDDWTEQQIERLLYIIARDNECEILVDKLIENENFLIKLIKKSFYNGNTDNKWQLAKRAKYLTDKELAEKFLEHFINDKSEYVVRQSLLTLAEIKSDKVESYCEIIWNKDVYGEMEEYQRIAVLHSLKKINSNLLDKYLNLAYKDGRKYLVENAREIEKQKTI